MIAACLVVAGIVAATIPGERFTLSWTHSIEKILWEEDYRVSGDVLQLVGSRIRGSGAGMEPQPGSVWKQGAWHRRENQALDQLSLTRSPYAGDYRWCNHSGCRPLSHWLGPPPDAQFVAVRAGAACTGH